jgi:homoserine O-acetyltransferase
MPLLASSRLFSDGPMTLEAGGTLPRLDIAYETWGELAPDAGNAVLICHGYTSNPHAAGWWPGLLGPGKAIDTARWFVVCANMLGSAYGSSGPPNIDPRSGRAYGPDFPDVTLADMAAAQERLLAHLGVRRLAAVIGYSFGGQLALQWAASRPERVGAAVVVASGLRSSSGPDAVRALEQRFAACPGWNAGHYRDGGDGERTVRESLRALRLDTLRRYGVARHAQDQLADAAAAAARLDELAAQWAREFDANALIALRKANIRFDATPTLGAIRAPLLYVLSRSDVLYPPSIAPATMALLRDAGVDASYLEIDSEYGHFAPTANWRDWGGALGEFLTRHA